jgi:hypothetical protein
VTWLQSHGRIRRLSHPGQSTTFSYTSSNGAREVGRIDTWVR